MNFKEIDYQILQYIDDKGGVVKVQEIYEEFPKKEFSTEYRIKLFLDSRYVEYSRDSQWRVIEGEFCITNTGRKALQDYMFEKNQKRKEFRWEIFKLSTAAALGYLAKTIIDFLK